MNRRVAVAEWVRALDWRSGGPGFESRCAQQLRFGTLAIPFTPLCKCLSEETLKSCRSLLISGAYARGSKISHQSAQEMCNLSCVKIGMK